MGKSIWNLWGYGAKQNTADVKTNSPINEDDFVSLQNESELKNSLQEGADSDVEDEVISNESKVEINSEEGADSDAEDEVISSTQQSPEINQITPTEEISIVDEYSSQLSENLNSETPVITYTNTASNFLTNMRNGDGAQLLANGLEDVGAGVGHFGNAGIGITKAALNIPALATQALTISQAASYLIFAADNAWLVGATVGQVPYAGTAVMSIVKVASTLMLVHPVLVAGVVTFVVIGVYQQPIREVCGGIKDATVEFGSGSFYIAKGAAELLSVPVGFIKDTLLNIGSTQNPTESATETHKVNLSDIKLLTPEQIVAGMEKLTKDFVIIKKSEEDKLEAIALEISDNQNDQNIIENWNAILEKSNKDNLANEIKSEQAEETVSSFTPINTLGQIEHDINVNLYTNALGEVEPTE